MIKFLFFTFCLMFLHNYTKTVKLISDVCNLHLTPRGIRIVTGRSQFICI